MSEQRDQSPARTRPEQKTVRLIRQPRRELERNQMEHEFAIDEVPTTVRILRREFLHLYWVQSDVRVTAVEATSRTQQRGCP